jgi:adenine-specific DNA-methyltransferase
MVIPAEVRVRFSRRIAALKRLVDSKAASAEEVASALLFVWAQRIQPEMAPKRAPNNTAALVTDNRLLAFVGWLCTLDRFEEAAYWVATAYATLVGEETRTQRALYFTHPVLAERVIDDLLAQGASLTDDHWHDPACGGAAFLVPVALRMRSALFAKGFTPREVVERISKNLSGNDTSATLIRFSETFLNLALAPVVQEAGCPLSVRISEGDGLRRWWGVNRPTVVICNPPYRKLKSDEAQQYRGSFDKAIQGQPNIYALFIEQSLRIVQAGGLVGLLTPTSYLAGPLFSNLRKHICQVSKVHSIDILGNRSATFLNVQQETAIATLRATPTQESQTTKVSIWADAGFDEVGGVRLREDGGPWMLPRSPEDKALLELAGASRNRLKDYGYTPRVGALVAYRSERKTHGSVEGCGNRMVVPLIWATDITPQGTFEHGRPHRQRASEPFIEVESDLATGVLSAPAVLLQRLTSTDQNRRLVAAALPSKFLRKHAGYVCENHVIALIQSTDSRWSPEELAAVLQTNLVDRLYRAISGSSNVGTYELGELPLPCPLKLRDQLSKGQDMESAIRKAFE